VISVEMNYFAAYVKESILVKDLILNSGELLGEIEALSQECLTAVKRGNKIILAGNGGSAADAQHIAAEFVSRFQFDRPALASISLTTDTSILTAIGNDYGFEQLFTRQLEANSKPGDVFIGITTSGNSANIITALKKCSSLGVIPYALTGKLGGKAADEIDNVIKVPSDITSFIQEAHIMIGHMLCGYVENELFAN